MRDLDLETAISNLYQTSNTPAAFAFELLSPNGCPSLSAEDADTLLFALGDIQDRAHRALSAWEREFEVRCGVRVLK